MSILGWGVWKVFPTHRLCCRSGQSVEHVGSWMIAPLMALVALTGSSRSQSLLEVSLTYLQRHGVPCKSVVKIDSVDTLDEVATCQDGSEWVLFWLENEIAFVHPGSHQLYRWRRDVHNLHPYLYAIEKGGSGQ